MDVCQKKQDGGHSVGSSRLAGRQGRGVQLVSAMIKEESGSGDGSASGLKSLEEVMTSMPMTWC